MPIRDARYNKINPANSRIVDVAKQTLREILPVQHRRYNNAFEINGYDCLVYTRLHQGIVCSCMGSQKALGVLLNEQGKMPQGKINEMIEGGMHFKVNRYGERDLERDDLRPFRGDPVKAKTDQQYDGQDGAGTEPPFNKHQGLLDDPFADEIGDSNTEDPSGSKLNQNLDDALADFDANALNVSDVSCGVCFGTGYVGGYAVHGSWRQILSTQWDGIRLDPGGLIEPRKRPHFFHSTWAEFNTILPKGFCYLDSIKVWNNTKLVITAAILIDGNQANYSNVRALCDGKMHTIRVQFVDATDWTHLEIQIGLSTIMPKVDFPNISSSADVTKLNPIEDLQVNLSGIVPQLDVRDLIVDHTLGFVWQVGPCSSWNDKHNNILGWTATVRVVQPNEVLDMLPRRQITVQALTANPVRPLRTQP